MNIALFPQMLVSSRRGWPEIEKTHPSITKLFLLMVVPLSLLPPIMLQFAGTHHGSLILEGVGNRQWGLIAAIFFLAEMVTFAAMGWLIKEITTIYKAEISLHDAYLLAAISPVPMWLSSLALLVPSLAFCATAAFAGLLLSCAIIYHGLYALCHMNEEMEAAGYTFAVMSAGLAAWVMLMALVVLPY